MPPITAVHRPILTEIHQPHIPAKSEGGRSEGTQNLKVAWPSLGSVFGLLPTLYKVISLSVVCKG